MLFVCHRNLKMKRITNANTVKTDVEIHPQLPAVGHSGFLAAGFAGTKNKRLLKTTAFVQQIVLV